MKDYFADLISTGVTGCNRGNTYAKHKETTMFSGYCDVTPKTFRKGNRGNKRRNSLHPVSPSEIEGETLKGTETAVLPLLHPVTPRNENLCYLYHERAAIMEFDGGASRHEAERLAYQDTLNRFLIEEYPEIVEQFESIIKQPFLD